MGGGWFLGSLPVWLQMAAWGSTLITALIYNSIHTVRSSVSTNTHHSELAVLTGKIPGKAKYFPGSKVPMSEIDLVPGDEIDKVKVDTAELVNSTAPLERRLAERKQETSDTETLTKRLGERAKTYDTMNGILEKIVKEAQEKRAEGERNASPLAPTSTNRLSRVRARFARGARQ